MSGIFPLEQQANTKPCCVFHFWLFLILLCFAVFSLNFVWVNFAFALSPLLFLTNNNIIIIVQLIVLFSFNNSSRDRDQLSKHNHNKSKQKPLYSFLYIVLSYVLFFGLSLMALCWIFKWAYASGRWKRASLFFSFSSFFIFFISLSVTAKHQKKDENWEWVRTSGII